MPANPEQGPFRLSCPTVPPAVKAAKALHCPLVAPPYADFPTTGARAFQLLPQQEGTELEVAKDRVGDPYTSGCCDHAFPHIWSVLGCSSIASQYFLSLPWLVLKLDLDRMGEL